MATKKSTRIFIWVIAVVMVIGTLGAYFVIIVANQNQQDEIAKQQELLQQLEQQQQCTPVEVPEGKSYSKPAAIPFDKESVTELKTEDVVVGDGKTVESAEDCLTVHYLGNTSDGTVFDNSYDRGEPAAFSLNGVIVGWQEGLMGMKTGGKRRIYIPADKAYGEQGNSSIGPNEPLVFEVDLIGIKE
jgi:FKBP-type peptidyl-prolyl cis-trans isomerase FklB